MSENKENEKKGFFSRLFGGLTASKDTEVVAEKPEKSIELPTKSALNKMKKADIVALAKDNGLELDIGLTKPNLLKAWDEHFADTTDEIVSNEEVKAEEEVASAEEAAPVVEEAPKEEVKARFTRLRIGGGTFSKRDRSASITRLGIKTGMVSGSF